VGNVGGSAWEISMIFELFSTLISWEFVWICLLTSKWLGCLLDRARGIDFFVELEHSKACLGTSGGVDIETFMRFFAKQEKVQAKRNRIIVSGVHHQSSRQTPPSDLEIPS
jgi:hypothetical protein